MASEQVGAIIESGPCDWQIVQRDEQGFGTMEVAGRWVGAARGKVQLRLVGEANSLPVTPNLDWQDAKTNVDGTWRATLKQIPSGGLYRLETRYNPQGNLAGEWSPRGDMRHFLGVGDLWVIAGQSNSAGYGRAPIYDPPVLGVHLFRNSEQWALATHPLNESTDTKHVVNREAANSGHSPYLHFGRIAQQEMGFPVGLVQTSLGGSPLTSWNPTEPGEAGLYDNMLHCIEIVGGKVKGVLWYQGESDTGTDESATSYEKRFIQTVQAWRKALKDRHLAVITVQLNRVYSPADEAAHRRWSQVREAQRQVPQKLADVAVVPSLDLSLSDTVHTSSAGNMTLGERMAWAALGMVYQKEFDYLPPNLQAARATNSRKSLELTFSPVTSRMGTINPIQHSFRVEDDGGTVDVTGVVYPGGAKVILRLSRVLHDGAVVHGGFGCDPATLPADMERMMPMLAFYGVPVE
ncbi:MAG TPA: sialate O-acetylesterase [Abditibacteriaceae bacterium]|nr:sialate O-acetylesterase [Abditibacteriaceae bacterium]